MINLDQTIPCPICKTKIPFDTQQLLMGAQFLCINCQSTIGLASESKDVVAQTMEKFERMKASVTKK